MVDGRIAAVHLQPTWISGAIIAELFYPENSRDEGMRLKNQKVGTAGCQASWACVSFPVLSSVQNLVWSIHENV
jgi:hypothetical protein